MANRAIVLDSSDENSSDSDDQNSESQPWNDGDDLVDDEAEEDYYNPEATFFRRNNDVPPEELFHQFQRLPPELRAHIWELFCPDLTSKGRMLRFNFPDFEEGGRKLLPNISLADQTFTLRIVSAIHQETRDLVVRKFPHTLPLEPLNGVGNAQVRFDNDRDICNILVEGGFSDTSNVDRNAYKGIRHLAMEHVINDLIFTRDLPGSISDDLIGYLKHFRGVEVLYLSITHDSWIWNNNNIRWAASDMARSELVETFEKEPGLGEDLEWIYSWPDLQEHRDFAQYNVIPRFREHLPREFGETADKMNITVAPMLRFEFESGVEEFDRLREEYKMGMSLDLDEGGALSDPAESASESASTVDEYESEGIDDSEIVENDESSEDEEIPRPITADDGSDDVVEVARFSSPEPENDGEGSGAPVARRPKRRIVSDSDDESDGGAPVAKRARRDAPVAISSDEDEDDDGEGQPRRARGRSRPQVISDDDDSDNSGDQPPAKMSLARRFQQSRMENRISSDDDDDSESSEDDQPPAKMSLAQRLQQSREENPIPSDDDSDEGGSGNGVGYDDDSDEEDEDDDDDDMERGGGGLIDDMAEDSDEGGESDEEEENSDEAW